MPINEGTKAPEFALKTAHGETVTLSGLLGKTVVLYFYPKDDTPGCTTEACEFRDNKTALAERGVIILGVSPDNEKSHRKFIDKFDLTFPLLADIDHQVADAYGVWAEKSMYGRKYYGNERTTFVIDNRGIIRKVFSKVKVTGHVEEVIRAVDSLS
jgi:peroxiredoxin Q/BCP